MALQTRAPISHTHELSANTSVCINQSLDVSVKVSHRRSLWRMLSALCACLVSTPGRTYEVSPAEDRTRLNSTTPEKRKTLVLDLDETLVHSSTEPVPDPDYVFTINTSEALVPIYVLIRPGLQLFLERAKKNYDIVVYTASLAQYANPLLDVLDYQGFINGRLFREDCILMEDTYVKDLDRLGKDLGSVIIVDVNPTQNSPSAYQKHKENAIPISTFLNDRADTELYKLADLLEELAELEDVRPALAKLTRHSSTLREESVQLLEKK